MLHLITHCRAYLSMSIRREKFSCRLEVSIIDHDIFTILINNIYYSPFSISLRRRS